MTAKEMTKVAFEALEDKKGEDINIIDNFSKQNNKYVILKKDV